MRAGQGHLSVCGSFPGEGEPSGCFRNEGPKGMKFKLILQRRKSGQRHHSALNAHRPLRLKV